MRYGSATLLMVAGAFLLGIPGCLTTLSMEAPPPRPQAAATQSNPVNFSFRVMYTGRFAREAKSAEIERLQSVFRAQSAFHNVVSRQESTVDGIYCRIRIDTSNVVLPSDSPWGWLSGLTAGIVPYFQRDRFDLTYDLSINGILAGEYKYTIHRRFTFFILLLPVAWMHEDEVDYLEQLQRTAEMFMSEAGLL